MTLPQIDLISAKMDQLRERLRIVGRESLPAVECARRVVAEDILAFRDSPATDVSAMDGYAVRRCDIGKGPLPVAGVATAGSAPLQLPLASAVRVFTGGPVPDQADCVVRREDCLESTHQVTIQVTQETIAPGLNIRRQGENAKTGDVVIGQGSLLSACRFAGALTFLSRDVIEVYRKVRVAIINTGDELIEFGQSIQPWQIRDSNGPFLESSLAHASWIQTERTKVADQKEQTEHSIRESLGRCDVLLLTGGVSMGDTDFVPDSIRSAGGETLFHRIPIRPGRPMLGAVGPDGQLILGLPGNPLSVAVTFRRYAMDLIRHIGGFRKSESVPLLPLETEDNKSIDLTWFRLVSMRLDGRLQLVASQGSGDIASLTQSDGFVEIPPNGQASGLRKYYAWSSI